MNRDQMLKEARTIEAMRKGYMGLEGTLSLIAKRLGQPIFHQGSTVFEQTFLDDPYEIPDENELPTLEEEASSYEIGLQFDGLSRGMNMSISIEYNMREIKCIYEGRLVYQEVSGELERYSPHAEWESKIENLSQIAKKIERQQKPIERQRLVQAADVKRKEILDALREKWGLE